MCVKRTHTDALKGHIRVHLNDVGICMRLKGSIHMTCVKGCKANALKGRIDIRQRTYRHSSKDV